MDEVSQIASRVIFIKHGKILLNEQMKKLNKLLSQNVHIISLKDNVTGVFGKEAFNLSNNMYLMTNDKYYKNEDIEQIVIRPLTLKDVYILLESNQYDRFIASI